jgi:hypothetical protein
MPNILWISSREQRFAHPKFTKMDSTQQSSTPTKTKTVEYHIIATMSMAQAGIDGSASDKKEVLCHRSICRLMALMGATSQTITECALKQRF